MGIHQDQTQTLIWGEAGLTPGATPLNFGTHLVPAAISQLEGEDELRGATLVGVASAIQLDTPLSSSSDAYLRLHLLSHCLVEPNTLNLEGLFRLVPIVAFTTRGPVHPVFAPAESAHFAKSRRHGDELGPIWAALELCNPSPGSHRRRFPSSVGGSSCPGHNNHARRVRQLQRANLGCLQQAQGGSVRRHATSSRLSAPRPSMNRDW